MQLTKLPHSVPGVGFVCGHWPSQLQIPPMHPQNDVLVQAQVT
jgi:hypothetical protein